MSITALFWDLGGVLLTNGWDVSLRRQAALVFGFDLGDFESRHARWVADLETGRLALDDYLDNTIFYRAREFTKDALKAFVFEHSQANPDAIALIGELARSRKYLLATLNNESLEFNQYRIDRFELRKYFTVFFSSCYLGVLKPDPLIYRRALQMTQRAPEECAFIDDRLGNLEPARELGIHAIQYRDARQVREELTALGVDLG
ncbi:MAG TPA: HAD family phosphatase [Myxococcaceae bacterium]|nr:HAD family phosphatase [Myxococcaceae bacterium]